MSSNLLIAFIILPLLGAAIAWAGDVIGYRLGKSRRSLFGLRPRSTARLVGALVGAALPLAGLLFAMAVSQDARDAILRIGKLRQIAQDLDLQNQELQATTREAQAGARKARAAARGAEGAREKAQTLLVGTEQRLQSSQASLLDARDAVRTTRNALAATGKDLDGARSDLSVTRGNLNTTRLNLSKAQLDVRDAKESLQGARAELKASQLEIMSSQAEIKNLDKLMREIGAAQTYLDELELDLAQREELLQQYQASIARYKRERRAIIEQDVPFEPGDEVIRGFVESGWTTDQLEAIIGELLKYASNAAASHGISAGPNGRAVRIVSPIPPDIPLGQVTESDIIASVARQIARGDEPTYVVIIRAWDRTFDNQAEPMTAELWVAPNKVVFEPGDTILTADVDGGAPRGHVFRSLWQTVSQIRRVAADRGMLPSPKTGHYGEVPAEELLAAMDQILGIEGKAQLRVVATTEGRVAQPEEKPMLVGLIVREVERD